MLVTGKEGTLHLVTGNKVQAVPLEGLPDVFTSGQGGLLDIALHPADKGPNVRVYMTMAHGSSSENRTILVQGTFDGKKVAGIKTLFRASPSKSGGQHFGSRLAWMADGTLLMSIGDGGNPPQRVGNMLARDQAQNLGSHNGSILRRVELDKDGKVVRQDKLDIGKRVRDVRQGPDGQLYVLTDEDNSRLLRIVPGKVPDKS